MRKISSNMKPINPADGTVIIQAITMFFNVLHFTARISSDAPVPAIADVTVCVVEIGA